MRSLSINEDCQCRKTNHIRGNSKYCLATIWCYYMLGMYIGHICFGSPILGRISLPLILVLSILDQLWPGAAEFPQSLMPFCRVIVSKEWNGPLTLVVCWCIRASPEWPIYPQRTAAQASKQSTCIPFRDNNRSDKRKSYIHASLRDIYSNSDAAVGRRAWEEPETRHCQVFGTCTASPSLLLVFAWSKISQRS